MPVLSPHRSSASALAGSYRSTISSSAIERPYFSSSTYNHPRITSFSEQYTARSYTDIDGRRVFSRSGSVTQDGITTRYREESRENSVRRDSVCRDSGISSIRENSLGDYTTTRRDSSSSTRDRISTINVLDSVAELRNKYSPANYVPACMRKNDNISRSKSINDIGLPPIETAKLAKKKVNNDSFNFNNGIGVINSNNTNNDNTQITEEEEEEEDDDNGNRASVADLRKKFDKPTKLDLPTKCLKIDTTKQDGRIERNGDCGLDENGITRNSSRVNNFASYIPAKDYAKTDDGNITNGGGGVDEDSEYKTENITQNDISTCTKLNNSRAVLSPSNNLTRKSSEREPSYDEQIYEKYTPILKSTATTTTTTTNTAQKILGLTGLKNIGNTCFMNSVIQCLSNTKLLLEYLRRDGYIKDINTSISSMKGALIRAFAEVIKELWSADSTDRVVNTVSLKSQIQRFAPRFIGYAQQDAQEFLRYLLEGLHEDVNRIVEKPKPILTEIDEKLSDNQKASESWSRYLRMDNSRIVDYFVGQLKSTLKCTHCGHCSVTFDPFWDLSLPIPQRTGQLRLSQCLESFTREETLDGDEKPTCSKCKERRKCTKSFTIQRFPQILVIHLKRFSPTERFRGKLNVTVDFPLEGLDMSQYAADGVSPYRYNLYAVSNHSGTTYSGHYTASCRHPYSGTWHEYNDSRVSSISPKSVVSGEAYVLFYEQEGQKSHL